ncbi:immunity 51 family protein [Plantactinospora alkalitolerans]|uniref:immunity 51 family protein n=1 Tax=Plantactinospora alkalitolerans TaxID=2789879 RepID=UPI002B1FFDE8|nr:immunity 51 family protein [Plantactinospora alkalitolerans]
MIEVDDSLNPFRLFEYDHDPGTYCLMLSDLDMVRVSDVFEECGYLGNGYDWSGVARSAVRTHAPEIADRLGYDPEAGTFVAHGTDPAALRQLGVLLQNAFQDGATLATLIRTGDPDWFD